MVGRKTSRSVGDDRGITFSGKASSNILTIRDHMNGDRRNSRYNNLQALHGHCHDAKTREHKEYLPVGMRDKHQHTEERRDRKRSCSVLEQR